METKFNVEGMSCSHCENSIKKGVSDINGVAGVKVFLEEKLVTVVHDEGVDINDIISAISEQGYDANEI